VTLRRADAAHRAGDEPGTSERLHAVRAADPVASPGDRLLLDDGRIELRVEELRPTRS
jgi:pyruvate kinase